MDYRQSGVDIDAGNEAVRRIKSLARTTFTPDVLSEIGSFGGLFRLPLSGYREPVLVSSADGVGTKLKLAFMSGRHDTVGQDLVNHCVNDILVQGATPLFFLDYLATGRLAPDVAGGRRLGHGEGVPRERLRAARRRDRRDARLLRGWRVRSRRLHRRHRRSLARDRRLGARAGRRADRHPLDGPAHQRLFAGAPHRVRHARTVVRQRRAGDRDHDWRGAARRASQLSARSCCP